MGKQKTAVNTTRPDGTRKVQVEQRPYQPKLDSVYVEPEFFPYEDDGLEILQHHVGKSVFKEKRDLPPRTDIIKYDEKKHAKEFNDTIKWDDCPRELRPRIEKIIKDNWDVFATEGLKYPIRGFQFHIDTGSAKPITCKFPRYGPHESRVISELAAGLESNGVIENDDGPWGSMVVLAGKPNQDDKHWTDYIWRLCVSFRKLNTITRPFTYNALRCDDAVTDIGTARYFIMMDMYWGYWQVLLHEKSRSKTAFFIPGGKKRFCRMAMGLGNSHPAYCCIFDQIKHHFDKIFTTDCIVQYRMSKTTGAKNIVDDLLLHSDDLESLFKYFQVVLQTLCHYRVTINLKKCRFFPKKAVFVGVDITPEGNEPAQDKFAALRKMAATRPLCTRHLRGLIGFMNFYSKWIVGFEVRIAPWRKLIDNCPSNDHAGEADRIYMANKWMPEDDELLRTLTNEILEKPTLARPDFNRRFYVKTDWCNIGRGAALLQANPHDPVALQAELAENKGGPCLFEKTLTPTTLRLRPLEFLSRRVSIKERHWHSYTGEAATGDWAFEKWKRFLLTKEFTWITDCSGLKKFFESDDVITHQHQRMRQRMLRFWFTIQHRNERMLTECDLLSRYYRWTQEMREEEQIKKNKEEWAAVKANLAFPSIPFCNVAIQETGPIDAPCTPLAEQCNISRIIWDLEAAFSTTDQALEENVMNNMIALEIESTTRWNNPVSLPNMEGIASSTPFHPLSEWKTDQEKPAPDWIILNVLEEWDEDEVFAYANIVVTNLNKKRSKAFAFTVTATANLFLLEETITKGIPSSYKMKTVRIDALTQGSSVQCDVTCLIIYDHEFPMDKVKMEHTTPVPISEIIELGVTSTNWSHEWDELRVQPGLLAKNALKFPTVVAFIETSLEGRKKKTDWTPVFDAYGPAPRLSRKEEIMWNGFQFLVQHDQQGKGIQGISTEETLTLLGVSKRKIAIIAQQMDTDGIPQLKNIVPSKVKAMIFSAIKGIEDMLTAPDQETCVHDGPVARSKTALSHMSAALLTAPLGLPLPTLPAWRDAIELDTDLRRVKAILNKQQEYSPQGWEERQYADELRHNRLELDDNLIYKYEVSARKTLRQVRTLVIPVGFRHIVMAACHSSPMSGHTDTHKTLWRTAARFWWPMMTRDISQSVTECAHCKVSNISSHEAQQMLKTVLANAPFDVMACDIWKPGDMPSSLKPGKSRTCKNLLTCLDIMTGFAQASHLQYETSDEIALAFVIQVIAVVGLPKLVVIDKGSEFAGQLIEVCDVLKIKRHVVTKENHKAVLSERFHRYLNKIQKIHAADCATFDDWLIGTMFAVYGWNSAPVDGTDIIRSFAAIGREFIFPIDVNLTETDYTADNMNFGEMTQRHVESSFPLLTKQRQVLKVLTEERRAHHRELKNKSRKQKKFAVGDLVLVRVQVQTSDEKGPGKLQLQARGPYRVLDPKSENTYLIQRIPFEEHSPRRAGKPYTESAARMEKLPSGLVIHNHTDGTDTKWACYRNAFVPTPLQHVLGAIDYGRFEQTPNANAACQRIDQLWEEIVEEPDSDEDGLFDEDSDDEDLLQVQTPLAPEEYDNDGDDNIPNPNGNKRKREGEQDEESEGAPLPRRLRFGTNTSRRADSKPKHVPPVTPERPTPILKNGNDDETPVGRRTRSQTRELQRQAPPPSTLTPNDSRIEYSPNVGQAAWTRVIESILRSRDKMLFVWYKTPGTAIKKWYVVQARPKEHNIDETRRTGVIRLRWFVRHKDDSRAFPVEQCRYWPEVHEMERNGSLGKMVMVRPGKVDKFLQKRTTHAPYELKLDLKKHRLYGPFNFAEPRTVNHRSYVIKTSDWAGMITAATQQDVDISDIGNVNPL